MNIQGIPALTDTYENYIWVMQQENHAWVVDPGEAQPVLDFLSNNELELKAILITHQHHDHINGLAELKRQFPHATVYGPAVKSQSFIDQPCSEGDLIQLNDKLSFKVLNTPGHTLDHIAFYNEEMLFCGDTLFSAGCGRILGGSAAQFADSILKLRALSDCLEFYSAHEYTGTNLAFAKLVEPENKTLMERIENFSVAYPEIHQGAQSILGLEKQTNPFMRFDTPVIKEKLIASASSQS